MESYRKSSDPVEVYTYSGRNTQAIVSLLDRWGVTHEARETKVPFGLDKSYFLCSITIQQDGNTFVLTPGKYLVRDNMNTISVLSEVRFKKLFDKLHNYE